jgi:hypothetical protein
MGVINCCHFCVPPKRHTACWDHCPEYAAEKAKHEKLKAADAEKRRVKNDIYNQRAELVTKAMKRHRKGK